jgi:hypothetical protein
MDRDDVAATDIVIENDPPDPFITFAEGFRPSKKGHLWCLYDGKTLTVFQDKFGRWCWCIADSEGPRFSPKKYDDQELALCALFREVTGL